MVSPKGFFKEFLQTQMLGLTGDISASGYPFAIVEWGQAEYTDDTRCGWWPYEQTGYWLDGYVRTAILLNDDKALQNASRIIYNVLNNPDDDGYLGPRFIKKKEQNNRWPHVVFFRACLALYDYNKDDYILQAITRHYLESPFNYYCARDVINAEIMCNVYLLTNDKRLLEKALNSYRGYNNHEEHVGWIESYHLFDDVLLSNIKPFIHGVSYCEYLKIPALLYKCTGDKYYLKVCTKMVKTLNKYFMLPSGLFNSDEYTETNYYYRSHETCNVTDFTWALKYLLRVTNDPVYGDMIEKCVFNAGIGCVLEDFKGLQYFSTANQLVADKSSYHCPNYGGKKQFSYRPNPFTECCPGNVNRFMPNYVLNMWRTEGKTVYCDLYGASEYLTEIDGNKIVIKEETDFPFKDSFKFEVKTSTPFTLVLRNPSYYDEANASVLGKQVLPQNGLFTIPVTGDCEVLLNFTANVKVKRIKKPNGKYASEGAYFERGPLVYAFGLKGKREIDLTEERSNSEFPAYNIYPDADWGYAVTLDNDYKYADGVDNWFDLDKKLPSIEVSLNKITNAKFVRKTKYKIRDGMDARGVKYCHKAVIEGDFIFTPDLLKTKNEIAKESIKIKLYPYGACKLRQTVFPINE